MKKKQPSKKDAAILDELVQRAKKVRKNAHAPYSKYKVGAALRTKSGKVFEGCNVENASFGATICAERGAVMQMIAAGESKPVALAVVTQGKQPAAPCGICRQVLAEFTKDLPIALVGLGAKDGEVGKVVHLAELLPLQFKLG
ncbi:MAG: cytidine deaminase [Labilithrix sp.]|nr:cytidine deaminase [Labilithrix sp.]MCW5810056.1 cytidine deaminase [Labilithrix sp.]